MGNRFTTILLKKICLASDPSNLEHSYTTFI